MISEGSYESNDAENSALLHKYIKIENCYFKLQ